LRNITVRIDEETYKAIEELTRVEKTDRSTVARKLIARGLEHLRRERALKLYREGKCTLWKASEMAGVPLREMIDLAKSEKIPIHFSAEDVDEAWRAAFEED